MVEKEKLVNEPRAIDLDLIDYSNKILRNKEIVIPHPRAHQRRFVMEPLAELDKNWIHPILKINIKRILNGIEVIKILKFSMKKKF